MIYVFSMYLLSLFISGFLFLLSSILIKTCDMCCKHDTRRLRTRLCCMQACCAACCRHDVYALIRARPFPYLRFSYFKIPVSRFRTETSYNRIRDLQRPPTSASFAQPLDRNSRIYISMYIYTYLHICIHMCIYTCIYIYIERERERDTHAYIYTYIYTYICIYIYIYIYQVGTRPYATLSQESA